MDRYKLLKAVDEELGRQARESNDMPYFGILDLEDGKIVIDGNVDLNAIIDVVLKSFSDEPLRLAHGRVIAEGLMSSIPGTIAGCTETTSPENLHWMMTQILTQLGTMPVDKQSRWIGFVQGVLALAGALDVNIERDRTRPLFHEAYQKMNVPIPESKNRFG
jgi:hypothetical protein